MFPQWDFTLLNGMLFVLLFVLIIYGIILIFIRAYVSGPSVEPLRGPGEYRVKCWLCGEADTRWVNLAKTLVGERSMNSVGVTRAVRAIRTRQHM